MFFAVQISRSWMTSQLAKRVYLVCAMLGGFFWIRFFSILITRSGSLTEGTLGLLFLPSVMGAAVTWVAMWYYWITVHPHDAPMKGFWLFVLILGGIGAVIYFFSVYLWQSSTPSAAMQRAATTS